MRRSPQKGNMKKCWCAILCAALLLTALPVVAFAGEDSETKAVENSAEAIEDDVAQEETLPPVEQVDAMIEAIDEEEPLRSMVLDALAAYDELTTAQKMKVKDYDKLYRIAVDMGIIKIPETKEPVNAEKVDVETRKNGKKYSLQITAYIPQMTLSFRYTTDTDGDGKMEVPKITVTDPKNNVQVITTDLATDSTITTPCGELYLTRTTTMSQLDVVKSEPGVWTFQTSNPVLFMLSDYVGETNKTEFTGQDEDEYDSNKKETKKSGKGSPEEEKAKSKRKSIIIMGVFIVLVVGVFIGIMQIPMGKGEKSTKAAKARKKAQKQGINPDTVKEQGNNGKIKPLTEEEELAAIRKEWEAMQPQYKDEDDKHQEKKNEVVDDERLSITLEDLDEDASVEGLDDDEGFFGKPRF